MNRDDNVNRRDRSESDGAEAAFGPELMAAYDEVGGRDAFVIAEIDRDEAWIAAPAGNEVDVEEWN